MKAATACFIDYYVERYRELRASVDALCATVQEIAWRELGRIFLILVRALWMLGISSQWREKRCNQ